MKITAVIASRNDDYGLNLTHRAFYCLKSMSEIFDEVIYVDWNSPNNISLIEQIKLEGYNLECKNLKELKVTQKFLNSNNIPEDAQPCCEVLARNIGIVRSSNDWIVSTNIDIIPTKILNTNLLEDTFYIGKKINVFDDFHLNNLKHKNLSYQNTIDLLSKNKNIFNLMGELPQNNLVNKIIKIIGCGDFQLAHKNLWNKIKGFEESLIYRNYADGNVMIKAYYENFNINIMDNYELYHLEHKNNQAFHTKDKATKCNSWDDATIKYSSTSNNDDWGFKNKEII